MQFNLTRSIELSWVELNCELNWIEFQVIEKRRDEVESSVKRRKKEEEKKTVFVSNGAIDPSEVYILVHAQVIAMNDKHVMYQM